MFNFLYLVAVLTINWGVVKLSLMKFHLAIIMFF
jgi:hypothetical protein